MNDDKSNQPVYASEDIAGYHYTAEILKDPAIFPYWIAPDIARIFGYSENHVRLLIRHGAVESFNGRYSRYVSTQSMNEYVARMNR